MDWALPLSSSANGWECDESGSLHGEMLMALALSHIINDAWLDAEALHERYCAAQPFPHLCLPDFIRPEMLETVWQEFPDLTALNADKVQFHDERQIKRASLGMGPLSPAAFELVAKLNSDVFLRYLQQLTDIDETLISDPYLAGGGYHETQRGGLLKIHADFNKHPQLQLDRRLNLLIYLNKDWQPQWGGGLQLYRDDMSGPVAEIPPDFNTAVIFSTTSSSYHGHPDALQCPEDRARRSLALDYFSTGRPMQESGVKHTTLFKPRKGEVFDQGRNFGDTLIDWCPPILLRHAKRLLTRKGFR